MTKEEVKKIVLLIHYSFPNWQGKKNDEELIIALKNVTDAWMMFLEDFSYTEIAVALKTYMNTSKSAFAPSVSELIGLTNIKNDLERMPEQEAWALVRKAISRSTYYSKEEFEKLPPIVREAVGSSAQLKEWATTEQEGVETVIASNFQRSYRTVSARHATVEQLPKEIKKLIETKPSDIIPENLVESKEIKPNICGDTFKLARERYCELKGGK